MRQDAAHHVDHGVGSILLVAAMASRRPALRPGLCPSASLPKGWYMRDFRSALAIAGDLGGRGHARAALDVTRGSGSRTGC